MGRFKAIIVSDIHLHYWQTFNEKGKRTGVSEVFLEYIFDISHRLEIPILFPGDMFHTPESVQNVLFDRITSLFSTLSQKYPKAKLIGISGNHDIAGDTKKGNYTSHFKSLAKAFPNIIECVDNNFSVYGDLMVMGIPYTKHNWGFNESLKKLITHVLPGKLNILLIHTGLYGAMDPNGYKVEEVPNIPQNMGEYFKDFDLVLCGHIHKPDMLWENKVYSIGAPYHQRSSDSGTDMGYWMLTENGKMRFKKYHAPEFKFFNEGEVPGDDYNYWIPIPSEKSINEDGESEEPDEFTNINDKRTLAREYFRVKGLKDKRRLNLLISVLNNTEL